MFMDDEDSIQESVTDLSLSNTSLQCTDTETDSSTGLLFSENARLSNCIEKIQGQ